MSGDRHGLPDPDVAREEWSAGLRTGLPEIDEEHAFQVRFIDEVEAQLRTGADEGERQQAIRRLVDFTSTHCNAEERAMREAGYPEVEAHCRAHEQLFDELLSIERDHAAGDVRALIGIDRLRDWLTAHVTSYDQPWAEWLRRGDTSRTEE